MTLLDLKNTFAQGTKFCLVNPDKDEQEFEITNLLWGNAGFFSMEVANVKADYNKLRIWVIIPEGVWEAWKEYSDKYYAEGR